MVVKTKIISTNPSDSFFECDVCGTCFSEEQYLVEHNTRKCIDQSQSKHQCYTCKKGFASDQKLHRHLSDVHLQVKDFECTVCSMKFGRKYHLHQHVRQQHSIYGNDDTIYGRDDTVYGTQHSSSPRLFTCDICGYTTTWKGHLTRHARLHTGEKRFMCRYCAMLFNTSSDLKRHLRIHTAVKPFTCSTCQKEFTLKHHLTSHVRTHTGDKPYQCPICNESFTQSSSKNRHVKLKHATEEL